MNTLVYHVTIKASDQLVRTITNKKKLNAIPHFQSNGLTVSSGLKPIRYTIGICKGGGDTFILRGAGV